ncbi:cell division protein ZapA [bacterium]|nr:cell division protein ZapA [bacterium]
MEQTNDGITVGVYGNSFTFTNVENPAQLHRAAIRLESRMKELAEKWRIVSPVKLAIMAALEMSIELEAISYEQERGKRVTRSILASLDRSLTQPTQDDAQPTDSDPFLLT